MKKIFAILLGAACTLGSCDLERLPYGSMASESVTNNPEKALDGLVLGCYAQMKGWADVMHRLGEYAGDNVTMRGTTGDAFWDFISYDRSPDNGRLSSFWNGSYKLITQSSNIIDMIEEGKSAGTDQLLGECYCLRGMMYFYLGRAFGRPYSQEPTKNLGVPIVNGTPDDVFNLQLPDRSTVEETYAQAIKDLTKSTDLMTEKKSSIYVSDEVAYALLSRIYLYMSGTWENPNREYAQLAVDYANLVIGSKRYELLGRSDFMVYNTFLPENNRETIFAVKRLDSEYSGYDYYYNIGGLYSTIKGFGWGEMYPSAKYMALLDETGRNDWREASRKIVDARANFIDPQYKNDENGNPIPVFRFIRNLYAEGGNQTGYMYEQFEYSEKNGNIVCEDEGVEFILSPIDKAQGIYSIKYSDGNTYKGYLDNFINLNRDAPMFYIYKCSKEGGMENQLHSPIISRLAEIYLNRAEAYAKLGLYGEALADLNLIRERSIPGAGYSTLDASNAAQRIDKERQLELAFQAERSFDVYRNGGRLERHYPGPHNAMLEVEPTDWRVMYLIPQAAINSYPAGSTLTQNPTSN